MRKTIVFVIVLSLATLCLSLGEHKPVEHEYRKLIRAQNLAKSQRLNEQYGQYYTSGETKFSHLSAQEFYARHTGYIGDSLQLIQAKSQAFTRSKAQVPNNPNGINADPHLYSKAIYIGPGSIAPSVFYVNWNGTNGTYVTNVKNQGACGSCWAFAGIAELESYYLWKHKLYLDLSEQQMVDCLPLIEPKNLGCGGGFLNSVGNYATKFPVTTERLYPYIEAESPCNSQRVATGVYKIKSYSFTYDCNHIANQLINVRPVGICLAIDGQWQGYKEGVLTSCNTGKISGHCVLLVGAKSDGTTDPTTNYWIVRNSWGTDYGEYGFMKLFKHPTDNAGLCGFCDSGIISA